MDAKTLSLECLQDGLLFGINYLKSSLDFTDFTAHFKEGDLILKGQKILSIDKPEATQPKTTQKDLAFLLSYLSGAYTLTACFTEKPFHFKIGARSTKDFKHKKGEEQALTQAGALLSHKPKKPIQNLQELSTKSKQKDKLFLSDEFLSLAEIKQALQNSPEQNFEVEAQIFPSDLEQWRKFKNIQAFYPRGLQGNFPRLKMQWTQ